jgi:NAD(P)-dependent dehydrogenase (short-subunit alcohol dehydrogenase family)
MKKHWNINDMPDQVGKTVLITGANDGLGLLLARAFAQKKAAVIIMACRNQKKAEEARKQVVDQYPGTRFDIVKLDLGDLQSVAACGQTVLTTYDKLDIVICNGGIMAVPYGTTKDNIEMHMGVNYYGHFALIGWLMPLIKKTPNARVVTISSAAEKFGRLNLDTPPTAATYNRWLA